MCLEKGYSGYTERSSQAEFSECLSSTCFILTSSFHMTNTSFSVPGRLGIRSLLFKDLFTLCA